MTDTLDDLIEPVATDGLDDLIEPVSGNQSLDDLITPVQQTETSNQPTPEPQGDQLEPEGAFATFMRPLVTKAIPAIGSAIGAAAGGALGIESGPGALATAAAGAGAGGWLGQKLQNAFTGDEWAKRNEEQMAVNAAPHNIASALGETIPFLVSAAGSVGKQVVGAGGKVIGRAFTQAGEKALVKASEEGVAHSAPLLEKLAQGAATGVKAGAAEGMEQGATTGDYSHIPDDVARSALTLGATGFIPEARSILMAATGRAVGDSAAMALAGSLYDAAKDKANGGTGAIDWDKGIGQAVGGTPAFAIQNAVMGLLHGHPLIRREADAAAPSTPSSPPLEEHPDVEAWQPEPEPTTPVVEAPPEAPKEEVLPPEVEKAEITKDLPEHVPVMLDSVMEAEVNDAPLVAKELEKLAVEDIHEESTSPPEEEAKVQEPPTQATEEIAADEQGSPPPQQQTGVLPVEPKETEKLADEQVPVRLLPEQPDASKQEAEPVLTPEKNDRLPPVGSEPQLKDIGEDRYIQSTYGLVADTPLHFVTDANGHRYGPMTTREAGKMVEQEPERGWIVTPSKETPSLTEAVPLVEEPSSSKDNMPGDNDPNEIPPQAPTEQPSTEPRPSSKKKITPSLDVESGQGGVAYFNKLGEQDAVDPMRTRKRSVPQNFKLAYENGWYKGKKTTPRGQLESGGVSESGTSARPTAEGASPPKAVADTDFVAQSEKKATTPIKVGDEVSFKSEGRIVKGKFQGITPEGSASVLREGTKVPDHIRPKNLNDNNPGRHVEGTKFALPAGNKAMPLAEAVKYVHQKLSIARSKVRVISEPSMEFRGRYEPDSTITINAAHVGSKEELHDVLFNHEAIHDAVESDAKVKANADKLLESLTDDERADIEAAIDQYKDASVSESDLQAERQVEAIRKLTANRPDLKSAWSRFVESVSLKMKKVFGADVSRQEAELMAARILARGVKRLRKGTTGGRVDGTKPLYAKPDEDPYGRIKQRPLVDHGQGFPTGTEVLRGKDEKPILDAQGKEVMVSPDGLYKKEVTDQLIEEAKPTIDSIGIDKLGNILNDPIKSLDAGIVYGSANHQAVAAELLLRTENVMLETPVGSKERAAAEKNFNAAFNAWQASGTAGGQGLGVRGALIRDPRYEHMFITASMHSALRGVQERAIDPTIRPSTTAPIIQDIATKAGDGATSELGSALDAPEKTESPKRKDIKKREVKATSDAAKILDKAKARIDGTVKGEKGRERRKESLATVYAEHRSKGVARGEFIRRATEFGASREEAEQLFDVGDTERAIATEKREAQDEEAKIEAANATAAQLGYRTEEVFRQGFKNEFTKGEDVDSIKKVFRDEVQDKIGEDAFRQRLNALHVEDEGVIDRLFKTAQREREDLAKAKTIVRDRNAQESADKQAQKLIYETTKQHRQSGYINEGSNKDSIRKAFQEQMDDPQSLADFTTRLSTLHVSGDVAERLFNVAEREASEREGMTAFERKQKWLKSGSPLLKSLVNRLRGDVSWREILGSPRDTMQQHMQDIFDRVRKHEALKDLTAQEQTQLTKELEKLWQKERQKQFKDEWNRASAGKKKELVKLVNDTTPELMRLMNLGMFSAETFRDAIAPKFGLKQLTGPEVKWVQELAQKIGKTKEGQQRRQLQHEMLTVMQDITGATKAQITLQAWVAAVLSGFRTQFETAASFLNGTRKFTQGAAYITVKGEGRLAKDAAVRYITGMRDGIFDAIDLFRTGNPTDLRNFDNEVRAFMESGVKGGSPYHLSEKIWRDAKESGKLWKIPPAAMIVGVNRMMQAWDHINVVATSRGMLPIVMSLNKHLYNDLKLPDKADLAAARKQALAEHIEEHGSEPKTFTEKRLVNNRAQEILDESIHADKAVRDDILTQAIQVAKEGSYQSDPTGFGGLLYHGVKGFAKKVTQGADRIKAEADAKDNMLHQKAASLLAFSSRFGEAIAGTVFFRFVGNRVNELIRLTPILGRVALLDKDMTPAKRAMILSDQAVGSMLVGVGAAALYQMINNDDEEKRGWRIEGGWKAIPRDKQRQMLSEGRSPYSIGIKRKDGSWGTIKYSQWPVAGIMATVGGMMDKKRYRPEEWDADSYLTHIANAMFGGATSIGDTSALAALSQTLSGAQYGQDPVEGLEKRLNSTMANFAGGFIPRAIKDLDYLSDPKHRKPDDFYAQWLKEIPVYRRSVGQPMMDIFGKQVELRREPWSRTYNPGPVDPEYQIAGKLAARGLFLPPSDPDQRIVGSGKNRRNLTPEEKERFVARSGQAYRDFIIRHGEQVLSMTNEQAKKFMGQKLADARDLAERQSVGK